MKNTTSIEITPEEAHALRALAAFAREVLKDHPTADGDDSALYDWCDVANDARAGGRGVKALRYVDYVEGYREGTRALASVLVRQEAGSYCMPASTYGVTLVEDGLLHADKSDDWREGYTDALRDGEAAAAEATAREAV